VNLLPEDEDIATGFGRIEMRFESVSKCINDGSVIYLKIMQSKVSISAEDERDSHSETSHIGDCIHIS
jgi:hypothetical protein